MTAAVPTADIAVRLQPTLTVAAGRVLCLAGGVFGASNLFQYGVQNGGLHLHPAVLSLSWPIAIGVFLTSLAHLRRSGGENQRRAAGWSRAGIGVSIGLALSLLAISLLRQDFTTMLWMTPAGLGVYGVAWSVAARRARRIWMMVPALGVFAAAAVAVALLGSPEQSLAYACGLLAFVFIPGAALASGRLA